MAVYRLILAAFLALALMAVGFAPSEAAVNRTTTKCADLVVLGVRGSGQPWSTTGTEAGFGPQASGIARNAVSRINRTGTVRYAGISYPAIPVDLTWTRNKYFTSVGSGAKETMRVVDDLAKSCSKTKVMLVGYSQGASVLRWAFRDMSTTSRDRVVAVGLIGDPERRGFNVSPSERGLLENYGSGTMHGSGILGAGPALPTRGDGTTVSMCHRNDNVCNRPLNFASGNLGIIEGFNQSTHKNHYLGSTATSTSGSTLYIFLARNGFK